MNNDKPPQFSALFQIDRLQKEQLGEALQLLKTLSPEVVRTWSHGEVRTPRTFEYRSSNPVDGGLYCKNIFGTGNGRIGHIELECPVAHIWGVRRGINMVGRLLDLGLDKIRKILNYESYIILATPTHELRRGQVLSWEEHECCRKILRTGYDARTGAMGLRGMLKTINLRQEIQVARDASGRTRGEQEKLQARVEILEEFIRSETQPEQFILGLIPVLSPEHRPLVPHPAHVLDYKATSEYLEWLHKIREKRGTDLEHTFWERRLLEEPLIQPLVRPDMEDDWRRWRNVKVGLDDLYGNLINRNNRLRLLKRLQAPSYIVKQEERKTQIAADVLIENGLRHEVKNCSALRKSMCESGCLNYSP